MIETFAKDLLTNPVIRDVHGAHHQVTAVVSSSSVQKAADFCSKVQAPSDTRVYGSFTKLLWMRVLTSYTLPRLTAIFSECDAGTRGRKAGSLSEGFHGRSSTGLSHSALELKVCFLWKLF